MFQPHRYSRTKALKKEFGSSFDLADLVYVTDIYAASEKPIPGVSGNTIVAAMQDARTIRPPFMCRNETFYTGKSDESRSREI